MMFSADSAVDEKMPIDAYISLLKPGGTFSCVGLSGKPVVLNPWQFCMSQSPLVP